jgi:galactose mutarotase-like enzyme
MSHWTGKIANHKQLGGIETSVLDNGAGRGVRIAWMDTGTGFRYKVVIDRAMDIADAFYNQHSLAWISPVGITAPQPMSNHGIDWLRTFGGGLLATCGLDHVGGPEADESGDRGVHGFIGNLPAEIVSIVQPDLRSGSLNMSITGIIRQHKIFGPCLTLKRTISGRLGEAALQIHDEVINEGNTAAPLMLLYHFNFGWPLVDEGTDIIWKGTHRVASDPQLLGVKDIKKCPLPLELHQGSGESVIYIDPEADAEHKVHCGLWNKERDLGLRITFDKRELPCLTNWHHFAEHEYVTGIEPGTNPPIGQKAARESNKLTRLAPGEKKEITLTLSILAPNLPKSKEDIDFLHHLTP